MVLVFDTDDMPGMKSCLKIFKQLAKDRGLDGYIGYPEDPKFGKIEFIKVLRDFEVFTDTQDRKTGERLTLRSFKEFADYVFSTKQKTSYITKWKVAR